VSGKNEEILEKIAKLLEVGKRNQADGFSEESQNAAALATKLILKYHLDESEVEDYASKSREDRENPLGEQIVDPADFGIKTFKGRIGWRSLLMSCVADSCSVTYTTWRYNARSTFVGRKTDTKAAAYIYIYLLREIEKAATSYMEKANFIMQIKKKNGTTIKRPFNRGEKAKVRTVYINGMVSAVGKKIELYRKEAVNGIGNPERAMVFLNRKLKQADDFMKDELGVESVDSKFKSLDVDKIYIKSLAAGYNYANDNIHLPQAIEGNKANTQIKGA
jgi:hypothetical protein